LLPSVGISTANAWDRRQRKIDGGKRNLQYSLHDFSPTPESPLT
jgi:hypothetical protein